MTKTFTAYKIVPGNQDRRDYRPNLSKQEIDKLPLGLLVDDIGKYTWGYGIDDGRMAG